MKIIFSEKFKRDFQKIRDKKTRIRILKQIKKIATMFGAGKYLGGKLKGKRSLRVKPFRIIYKIENGDAVILCFDHRKRVYEGD